VLTTQYPEFEHRLSVVDGWEFSDEIAFELGLQYRLADFIPNFGHELFFFAGLEIVL